MKKPLKRFLTFIIFLLIAVSIGLLIAGKVTGNNYFENIKNSLFAVFISNKPLQSANQNTPLEVMNENKTVSTLQNSVAFTIKTNREIKIDDSQKIKLFLSQKPTEASSQYWYVIAV